MDIYYGFSGASACKSHSQYGFHNFPPVYNALIRGFRGTVVRAIREFGKCKGNDNMVINNSINPQRQRRM